MAWGRCVHARNSCSRRSRACPPCGSPRSAYRIALRMIVSVQRAARWGSVVGGRNPFCDGLHDLCTSRNTLGSNGCPCPGQPAPPSSRRQIGPNFAKPAAVMGRCCSSNSALCEKPDAIPLSAVSLPLQTGEGSAGCCQPIVVRVRIVRTLPIHSVFSGYGPCRTISIRLSPVHSCGTGLGVSSASVEWLGFRAAQRANSALACLLSPSFW
jgi:hypothetical protein